MYTADEIMECGQRMDYDEGIRGLHVSDYPFDAVWPEVREW